MAMSARGRSILLPGLALGFALGLVPQMGGAQEGGYRLTPGDVVQYVATAGGDSVQAKVDPDGRLRIAEVGGIEVASLTLDEAEAAIELAIVDAGMFVSPSVMLAVTAHAPVVVTGDVQAPGRFDYFPQLTVGTAIGLSGGTAEMVGVDRVQLARARADVEQRLMSLNLEITATVARIARLETQLGSESADVSEVVNDPAAAEAPPVSLSVDERLRAAIPVADETLLAQLIDDETAVLRNARARRAELLAFWEEEIAALGEQQRLLVDRIALQRAIVEGYADDLANAATLVQRGLATASSLTRAEQVEADAQARILELESALTNTERGKSDAARQRVQFLRNTREEALAALRDHRTELRDLRIRHDNALQEQSILAEGNPYALVQNGLFEVNYTLVDGRSGETRGPEIGVEERMLPGDTLIVRVDRLGSEGG